MKYTVRIENDLEDTSDFLISEENYNKYLSITDNNDIKVGNQKYKVEDLISSNFVIEGLEPNESIEFSFEVVVDENYDGEVIKNEIQVCNTIDNGCVNSETKIMGNVVQEEVEATRQNPYAKLEEGEIGTDKIKVDVSGADVSNLLKGNAEVNLYLQDELIDSQNLNLGDKESEHHIVFDNDILSNTRYKITVEGKYEDYETGNIIEGVLTDGSAQGTKAQIEVKTEKTGDEPEVGDIRVSSSLKELTSNSVKFTMSIKNPTNDEINSGKVIFNDNTGAEVELVLTNDNIDDLMDGDTITLLKEGLAHETKYDIEYEFYDRSDELIGGGTFGEIETDTLAPTLSFNSTGNIVDTTAKTASGTLVINNKQAIINSTDAKVYVTLIEYDTSGNILREEVQEYEIDDTINEISYNFSNIDPSNSYEIKVKTIYNVDNMFDKDGDEGTYEETLISFDGNGGVLYSVLTAVYDMSAAIIDANSITISFEIQNPNSKIIDDTNMTVRACKRSDLTNCSAPVFATLTGSTYTVTIIGLNPECEYKLIANAPISETVGSTSINQDIPGATSTDIFTTSTASVLDPPVANYSNIQVNNNVLDIGGKSSVEATLEIVDNNSMLDTAILPKVEVYTDMNEDGIYDLGDDTLVEEAIVSPKSGPFNTNKYTVTLGDLDKGQPYQFYTQATYSGTNSLRPMQSLGNIFNTQILGNLYVEYENGKTEVYENGLITEFTLVDAKKQAQSLGEVSVYTDLNRNGLVDEMDSKIDSSVEIIPISGLTYKVEISNLEENTTYQLHNEISSVEDGHVYEVDSINNVFTTKEAQKEVGGNYNLYIEPKDNVIDSYTMSTAQIEVGLSNNLDELDDIANMDIKFVNKNDMLDTHVISLTKRQLQNLKSNQNINLYVSDLEAGSEYIIYGILDTSNGQEIVECENNIYTDYDVPKIMVSNKKIFENSIGMDISVDNTNSYLKDIKVVNNTLSNSQNINLINNSGSVKFDNLEPNEEYEFSITYDYLLDNKNYLSAKTNTEQLTFVLETIKDSRMPISTCQDLQNIQSNLVGSYYLESDIDCENQEFEPISAFGGNLDGQGHSINNLVIDKYESNNIGLISNNSGNISNIIFNNLSVEGKEYVGLVGQNSGIIEGVTLRNSKIVGNTYIGSIAGINTGTIDNIMSDATLQGKDYVGSLAGSNQGNILDVRYTGNIECLGANVNLVQEGEISYSQEKSILRDDNNQSADSTVDNNYSDNDYVGGILGINNTEEENSQEVTSQTKTDGEINLEENQTNEDTNMNNDTEEDFNLYNYIRGLIVS